MKIMVLVCLLITLAVVVADPVCREFWPAISPMAIVTVKGVMVGVQVALVTVMALMLRRQLSRKASGS